MHQARVWLLLLPLLLASACALGGGSTPTAQQPTPTASTREDTPTINSRPPTSTVRQTATPRARLTTAATSVPTATAPTEIAYLRGGEVWLVAATGGKPRRIASGHNASPAWSPAGRAVAYVRLRAGSGGGALILHPIDGRPRVLVGAGVTQLAWSPDAKRLAYTRTVDRDADRRLEPDADRSTVSTVEVASGRRNQIGPGFDPAWSPNGGVLLSTPGRVRGGVTQGNALRFYPPGGPGRVLVATSDVPSDLRQYGTPFLSTTRRLRHGALSPDGKTVAFSALGGVGILGTREVRGGQVQVQDLLAESGFGPVVWAPVGSRIAYHAPTPQGADEVTVLDINSGNRTVFGRQGEPGYREPAWSANGRALALVEMGRDGPRALVVSRGAGGRVRALVRGPVSSPSWSR